MRNTTTHVKTVARYLLLAGSVLLMGSSLGCGGGLNYRDWQLTMSNIKPRSSPVWTADGSHIIFSRFVQGMFMVDVAGTRLQRIPANAPIGTFFFEPGYFSPALSPDGSRLAFVVHVGNSNFEIATADLDGANARRLSHNDNPYSDFAEANPVWSPDGSRIAYIANRRLTLMDSDGSNAQVVVPSIDALYYPPAWSPDGSWLAFVGWHSMFEEGEDRNVIYIVRPDGSELRLLGDTDSVLAWSPDGSRIAFIKKVDGERILQSVALDGTDARSLLSLGQAYPETHRGVAYDTLAWSPDGSAILFTFSEPYRVIPNVRPDSEVVVVSVGEVEDGKRILAKVDGAWAAWSPDGLRIAVVTALAGSDPTFEESSFGDVLYTMARDGTDRRVLVQGDGKHLVVARSGG